MSVLLAYQKFVPKDDKDKLNNSIAAIFKEIIDATSYDYSTEKFKHGKFLNLLSKLTRKEQKLNIVTTNYDTLIEDAANKEGFTVLMVLSLRNPQYLTPQCLIGILSKRFRTLKLKKLSICLK